MLPTSWLQSSSNLESIDKLYVRPLSREATASTKFDENDFPMKSIRAHYVDGDEAGHNFSTIVSQRIPAIKKATNALWECWIVLFTKCAQNSSHNV